MEGHGANSLGVYLLLLPFYFVTVFASFFPWSIKLPSLTKKLLLSRDKIDPDLSVLDDTAVDVRIKRGMLASATEVVLLADSEKFGEVRPVRVCGPADIGVLVTDSAAPESLLAAFEAAGVRVIRA